MCYVIRGGGPGSHLAAGACARAGCCVGMKHIKQAHASMRTEREPNPRNGSFYSAYFILGSSVADYLFVMGLENCWIIPVAQLCPAAPLVGHWHQPVGRTGPLVYCMCCLHRKTQLIFSF